MAYIFDTNILIRSKNEMPIELWPSFWSKLCQMMADYFYDLRWGYNLGSYREVL